MIRQLYPHLIWEKQDAFRQSTGQCDCDCACTFTLPANSRPITRSFDGLLYKSPSLQAQPLTDKHSVIFDTIRGSIAVADLETVTLLDDFAYPAQFDSVFDANRNGNRATFEDILKSLVSLGFLVSSGASTAPVIDVSSILSAWLHLTDRCNLRCAYCYLSHTPVDMNANTGRAVVDSIFRSAVANGYQTIKLKYAGGEPLLRFPLIKDLHQYAQVLARKYDLDLDGVVLSNGTLLTMEMIETMQRLGLRLMISLDGIGEYHDCHRSFPDGSGSFDSVTQAIDLALGSRLVPDISITISGRNAAGLAQVVGWVLDRDLPFSINFYRENSQSARQTDLQLEDTRIIMGMLEAYAVIEAHLPHDSLLASLIDRGNLAATHLRPCNVGQSYLAFDAQGYVAKCQMDMMHTVTNCNDPDPLKTLSKSTKGLQNPSVDAKIKCQNCQWRYWCAGGCPLQSYLANGCYDGKSPYCTIYQVLYPEIIRLEGLRLLYQAEIEIESQVAS